MNGMHWVEVENAEKVKNAEKLKNAENPEKKETNYFLNN